MFVTNRAYLLKSTYLKILRKLKQGLRTSISGTDTSSLTFTLFTATSFIK